MFNFLNYSSINMALRLRKSYLDVCLYSLMEVTFIYIETRSDAI